MVVLKMFPLLKPFLLAQQSNVICGMDENGIKQSKQFNPEHLKK